MLNAAESLDPSVLEALEALKTYKWGDDRGRLNVIDRAINASHGKAAVRKELEGKLLGILGSDAPRAARVYVCRKLALMGSEASIPPLAALLPDEKMSHMGRYALERMASPRAAGALRNALGKVDGSLEVGVINSLGARRDAKATPALIARLEDKDPEVAAAAAAALGRIATPEAAEALAGCLKKAPEALEMAMVDAALDAAGALLHAGKNAAAAQLYAAVQARAKAPYLKKVAQQGLAKAR
jgi:HEAT repeat protein